MAAEVCAGTSSTSDKERMEATVTAMNMIANGRRNVVCGEIPTAVNQFQEACKLLAKAYGETAKECAEAYFYYGQALLDLARMETGVLGNALQGVPDTDEDEEDKSSDDQFEKGDSLPADERERLRDEVYEAMADPEEDQSKAKDVKKDVEPASGETVELAMDVDESKPATVPEGKVSEEQGKAEKEVGEKEDENNPDVEKKATAEKQEEETVDIEIEEDNAAKKDSEKEDSKPSSENKKKDIEDVEEGEKESEKKCDEEKEQAEDKEVPEDPKVEKEKETKLKKSDEDDTGEKEETKIADGEKEQIKLDEKEEQVDDGDEPQDTKANGEERKKESNEGSESTEKENGTEEEGEEEEGEETLDEGETSQDEKEPKEGEAGDESPDDISNLQLAWEMLELAKVIYLKEDTKESKIKAAEAHLKLGEVSLETEQYEQAVEDFNQCLKIQKEFMEPEDRALAETYYQLGLAFGFNKQYDQAIESYKTAIKTIEDKIAKLTKFIEEKSSEKGKEPVDFDDPVTQAIQEIKDLKDILPDICTKIEDTEEEKRQVDELKAAAKEVIGFTSSSVSMGQTMETSSATKSDVKVTDISHLIKRKRKPEEEEEAGEEVKELKKTRQEDGSGDATTKENGNDHALEKDQPQDVPMEEANPAEVTAS